MYQMAILRSFEKPQIKRLNTISSDCNHRHTRRGKSVSMGCSRRGTRM
jgi:hypothetical protein